jgi:pimeloyl-ACP methyl ester carboxylesterase
MASSPPDIPGVAHRYVDIETADAGRVRVHCAEAGSGEPVLMLHGWPQHVWSWRHVVPRLADRDRLICPDLRGFGWTDTPGRGYDSETFASDAVALLDALELERVKLIGHDWGGFAGFLLALRHPERVERYLALNCPVPWAPVSPRLALEGWRSWYTWVLAAPGLGRRALARRPGLAHWILRHGYVHEAISDADAALYAERLREPARNRASILLYRSYQRAFADVGVRRRYHGLRLTVPTRLVFGARDLYVSTALTRGWEDHADDMAVEYVPDSGHFIAEERPELVAERALELFGSVASTR